MGIECIARAYDIGLHAVLRSVLIDVGITPLEIRGSHVSIAGVDQDWGVYVNAADATAARHALTDAGYERAVTRR